MRQPIEESRVLERAAAVFELVTGVHVEVQSELRQQGRADAWLDIYANEHPIRFAAEIKAVDRFETLGTVKAETGRVPYPTLLVAPYITEAIAARCRELRISFIDEAGNAYIEAPGLFVYVAGKRRPIQAQLMPAFRALTPAGLRIVFVLLNNPEMAAASYREIAKAAQVALGTVGNVLADMERRGYLAPEKPGPRRLLTPERLQDEWVTHYPIKLRPKLNVRRFTAPTAGWWREQDIRQHHAYWGGEVAAEKLTGYLKAAKVTVYVAGKPDRLILENRLRPDVNGEIEILEAFWAGDEIQADDIAPPLVVYADLMATIDPRNLETANLIRGQFLAKT